jgi:hypothetical protein
MSASPATSIAETTNLFVPEDLEDVARTRRLAESDLNAVRSVADWIKTFVANPHEDLGRPGPVCPFVPGALERKTLWLAPEAIANRSVPEVAERIVGYKRLFLRTQPTHGDDVDYKAIVVVFTDLPVDRASDYFTDVEQDLKVSSYVDDGLVFGEFYGTNEGSAIYNTSFRPFTPPVPFLLMRQTVISDWKFFLDDEDWLNRWARRFGESAVFALAEELRRFPWNARRD